MTDDPHLLTGAYALDSLDEVTRAQFERHLADCPDCQREVRELREAVATMGAAEQTPPPPALREAVVAEVSRTAQLPPHTVPAAAPRARRWLSLLAVAAVAVLAFGIGTWVAGPGPVPTPQDDMASIVAAPDARMAPMALPGAAHSKVIVSPAQGRAVMVGDGMTRPADGNVYQLWLIDDGGAAHGMDTFVPDADGTAEVLLAGDFSAATALAVTIEPAGGSAQPTSQPLGTAEL